MSLFDVYAPAAEQRCPSCDRPLRRWQGKDGPNGLFEWREGQASPVGQLVDEDLRVAATLRDELRLPARFVITSNDCLAHRPAVADCRAPNGVWTETVVRK